MKQSMRVVFVAMVLALGCVLPVPSAMAQAEDGARPTPRAPGPISAEVGFAVYLWLPSIGGESGVGGDNVDIDASFFDLLDETDTLIGFMAHAELNINGFLILLDPVWTKMEKDDTGAEGDKVDVTLETLWFDIDVGYRFVDNATLGGDDSSTRISVDGLVGVRLTQMTLELNRSGPADDSFDEYWIDPLVGGRVTLDFGERFGMVLRGDIGGFGAGSDLSAGMTAVFGYRFHIGDAGAAVFAGYRALYQDYENNGFEWRAWVHGPILGMQITF